MAYPSVWTFAYNVRFQGNQIASYSLSDRRDRPLDHRCDWHNDAHGNPLIARPECDEGGDEAGDEDAGATARRPVMVHDVAGGSAMATAVAVGCGQDVVVSALLGVGVWLDGHGVVIEMEYEWDYG